MGENTVNNDVRGFLETYIPEGEFKDDDDIFEMGLVNSLMAMQLVLFLEKKFDLHLARNDLDFANFRTVNRIANLVDRKLGEKRGDT